MTAPAVFPATSERIIFVPETSAFGGGERVLLALSRYLHERSLPHRFCWYFRTVDLSAHANWPIREEYLNPVRRPLQKVKALDAYLCSNTTRDSNGFLLVGLQAALHAGLCSARNYSLMILDTPSLLSGSAKKGAYRLRSSIRQQMARPLVRRAMRRAKAVMVTSDYMSAEVRALYNCDSVVVRQGAPKGEFKKRAPASGGPLRLLSVCRLEPNKRVDWIIRSLANLAVKAEEPANLFLDVVGAGAESDMLKALVRELCVGDRVTFHGRLSDADLENVYDSAHLFLMPARQGYGLPALEALTRGIPVVLHQESGVSEILRQTRWAETIGGDDKNLCEAIRIMARRIQSGELLSAQLPKLPSEDEWAEEVCRRCGWLP